MKEVESVGDDGSPELDLNRSQRVNAGAVVLVYQALIFAPVFVAVFVVFLLVGRAAVSDDLLKNWIYGDNAKPEDHASFHTLPFLSEPWTRMAFFLAVFSLLYFAVSVLTNEQLRREFFAGADEGIRQRSPCGSSTGTGWLPRRQAAPCADS